MLDLLNSGLLLFEVLVMLKILVCRANKLPQQEMGRGSLEVGAGRDKQSFNNYLQSSNPTLERLAAIEVGASHNLVVIRFNLPQTVRPKLLMIMSFVCYKIEGVHKFFLKKL